MGTSKVMEELRNIRDANSAHHLSQTPEEHESELQDNRDWFLEAFGEPVKFVAPGTVH